MEKRSKLLSRVVLLSGMVMSGIAGAASDYKHYIEGSFSVSNWDAEMISVQNVADGKFEPGAFFVYQGQLSDRFVIRAKLDYEHDKHINALNGTTQTQMEQQTDKTATLSVVRSFLATQSTEMLVGFGLAFTDMELIRTRNPDRVFKYAAPGIDFFLEGDWYFDSRGDHKGVFLGGNLNLTGFQGKHEAESVSATQTMFRANATMYAGFNSRKAKKINWQMKLGVAVRANEFLGSGDDGIGTDDKLNFPINSWGQSPGHVKAFGTLGIFL